MIAESIDLLNTKGIQKVTRICDECGKRQLTNVKQILYGRKLRSSDIDLCFGCSNLGKYRKLPIGKKNGHWKHGLTYQGYRRVNINGQRMLIHTVVMEKHLGRKLEKGEGIHHIDLNKLNNNIANIEFYENVTIPNSTCIYSGTGNFYMNNCNITTNINLGNNNLYCNSSMNIITANITGVNIYYNINNDFYLKHYQFLFFS